MAQLDGSEADRTRITSALAPGQLRGRSSEIFYCVNPTD